MKINSRIIGLFSFCLFFTMSVYAQKVVEKAMNEAITNQIKGKKGIFYLAKIPNNKSVEIDDVNKFCKDNKYGVQNIKKQRKLDKGTEKIIVLSFEFRELRLIEIDKQEARALAAKLARQKAEKVRIMNQNIPEHIAGIWKYNTYNFFIINENEDILIFLGGKLSTKGFWHFNEKENELLFTKNKVYFEQVFENVTFLSPKKMSVIIDNNLVTLEKTSIEAIKHQANKDAVIGTMFTIMAEIILR